MTSEERAAAFTRAHAVWRPSVETWAQLSRDLAAEFEAVRREATCSPSAR